MSDEKNIDRFGGVMVKASALRAVDRGLIRSRVIPKTLKTEFTPVYQIDVHAHLLNSKKICVSAQSLFHTAGFIFF